MLVVITIVALAFAVQEHNDRVLSEELTETASELKDTAARIASIRGAEMKKMDDYVRAFSEIGPLLDNYDQRLQRITDLYNQARERDKRFLSIERPYRRPHLTNWESMSEILDITRALNKVMRQETSVIQNMAQLPEPERMQFWHEHFLPLEAQEKGLRPMLLIVGQRMSPAEQWASPNKSPCPSQIRAAYRGLSGCSGMLDSIAHSLKDDVWSIWRRSKMPTADMRIIVAILFAGLLGFPACDANDRDEQQASASKGAASQQTTAQKPAEKPNVEEEEEGEEGPAVPPSVAAEKPAPLQAAGKQFVYNFDNDPPGQLPAKFHTAKTGGGPAEKWSVVADPAAPSRPNVVAQTSTDQTDYRFPLLISDEGSFQDLDLSVRFKAISGSVDRAGGLVFRLRDPNNYYIVRANALENNYRLYHVVNGRRSQFAGANFKVTSEEWHELRVKATGNKIICYYDGDKKIEATDSTFKDACRVGLWTKADSVSYFDDLKVTAK